VKLAHLLPRTSDYRFEYLGADLIAGVTVAIVALPLALGFAVSTGVSPAVGVTTAIVAGIVAAFFGGSNFQVSGPTGAMTVVLIPIVASRGPEALPLVASLPGCCLWQWRSPASDAMSDSSRGRSSPASPTASP
jgi:SulP family sulfate permease